mmetsp:Transcript_56973/g.90272  ORF Transcript_56973/g.90272 Transcript_56973/m.90272 type:complete len:289 (+) Transcript_56973:1044-1910(+)
MLPRAGLGDDSFLSQFHGQQCLSNGVVDLVGTCVCQLLSLEPNLRSAAEVRQALGEVERRGAADEVAPQPRQLGLEDGVDLPLGPGFFQLVVGHHQRLWDETTTEDGVSKVPLVCMFFLLLQVRGCSLALGWRLNLVAGEGQRSATQLVHQRASRCDTTLTKLLDDAGSHHTAVSEGTKLLHVLSLRDAKADHHRELGAQLLGCISHRLHHGLTFLETIGLGVCLFGFPGACDAQKGHHIDHAGRGIDGSFSHLLDALGSAGGRRQWHEAQVVLGRGRGHDSPRFFHW